ncbi:MAG: LLM class flavin-dependent oxidoreductase [Chloroflexi bacterium]|nr:LLM class flavin-dependent oxidoreductase [Chloroflexota bacterium]
MTRVQFGVGIYTGEPSPHILEQARLAEHLGYDTLWLLDSQLAGRELYTTMALCALETSRIKIGSGVTQSYTRQAAVTANAFATLDSLAPGRFLLGIGRGDSAVLGVGGSLPSFRDFAAYVRQVETLLRGEPVDLDGHAARLTGVDPAHPVVAPVYIAADGPRSLESACAIADRVIMHPGAGQGMLARAMGLLQAGAHKAGKSPLEMEVVWWMHTSIHADWSKVKEHYRPRMAGTFRHLRGGTLEELGVSIDAETFERARAAYDFSDHATAGAAHGAWADLFPDEAWKQLALLGTADEAYATVSRGLDAYPEISHVVINPPASGFGITIEGIMQTFAGDVMPRLQQPPLPLGEGRPSVP